MNISSMKKVIWIFVIGFLMVGSFSFWLNCDEKTPCPSPLKCDGWICVNIDEVTVTASKAKSLCNKDPKWTRVGSESVWICNCPDNTKRIDDQWCRPCTETWVCCGIELNTTVPFIGNCIELSKKWSTDTSTTTDSDETTVTEETAFPTLMGGLTKMMVTIILLIGFIAILAGGVMIAASGGDDSRAGEGKKLIGRVIIALALLGASGVILRLINPNFFG